MTLNQVTLTLLLVPVQAAVVLGVSWLLLRNWLEQRQLIVAAMATGIAYWVGMGTYAKNDVVAGIQIVLMPGYPILLTFAAGWFMLRRVDYRQERDR